MRVDVVRRDPQAFVPESEAVQRLGQGLDHKVGRVAGQRLGTLATELEFKLAAGQRFHSERVMQREGQAEAVVAGTQVGAGGRHPHGDQLARRNGRGTGS